MEDKSKRILTGLSKSTVSVTKNVKIEYCSYNVYLRDIQGQDEGFFCGGSIISQRLILTAASCVENRKPLELMVYTGTNSTEIDGERHRVENFTIHGNYKRYLYGYLNDIAVIEVFIRLFNCLVAWTS